MSKQENHKDATVYTAAGGTATVELTILEKPDGNLKKKSSNLEFTGCFIKNDDNLHHLIDKPDRPFFDRKKFNTQKPKYLFYSPFHLSQFQGDVTKAVLKYKEISEKKKSKKLKTCHLENNPLVFTFNGHLFLCCDSEDLNKSKSMDKYSKEYGINQTLDFSKRFYGLGMENDPLKFISFKIHQTKSGSYYCNETDFNKLQEVGPLLLENNKTIVGYYRKVEGNCRIKIYLFENSQVDSPPASSSANPPEEELPPASSSANPPGGELPPASSSANSPEGEPPPAFSSANSPEGEPPPASTSANPPEGEPPPASSSANSPEGEPPPASTSANSSEGEPPPASTSANSPEGHNQQPDVRRDRSSDDPDGIPFGVEQQPMFLSDFFEKDAENIRTLSRYLDRRSLVIKNYEDLASRLKAPTLIIAKCKSNIEHSPTLDLMQLEKVSTLSVNALVKKLEAISRNDVANKIKDIIPENERECLSVKNALIRYEELFEQVAATVDTAKRYNWKNLGHKLGIPGDEVKQIGLGCNPTERLLVDYVYPTMEAEELTVARFRDLIKKIERRSILNLLSESGITEQDDCRSIKDVIPPDSEIMWKLCLELNNEVVGLKNWKHLASSWGIKHEIYSQFKPNQKTSPTEILLKEWLIGERPTFTVNALCHLLGEIKRNDAKEFLEGKLQEYSQVHM